MWAPISTSATRNLPMSQAGAAAGVYNTTRQIGAVLGSAGIAVLMQARIAAELPGRPGRRGRGAAAPGPARGLQRGDGQALLLPPRAGRRVWSRRCASRGHGTWRRASPTSSPPDNRSRRRVGCVSSAVPPPVTVRVPAKINLHLEVGGLRDDGFHDLVTVFHAVSLFDEVSVAVNPEPAIAVHGEGVTEVPADETNLAWRAVQLLAERADRDPDVALVLRKGIPVAGGMAGGSADAAARWSACPRCGSSTCPATSCPASPPSWAATSRSRCTAAPRSARAGVSRSSRCCRGTPSTG